MDWSAYESYLARLIDVYGAPGVGIAVAVNGAKVYSKGFGYRDREHGLPVTDDTVFGIGSNTKSFTAMAILQLEEEGRLSVDDLVVKYLPEFRVGKAQAEHAITIHHFLTHTSGLPPITALYNAMVRTMKGDPSVPELPELKPIDTYEELMDFIANDDFQLVSAPGTRFSYSNEAYGLLGAIIERVSGSKYEEFITERILKPVGMVNSTFNLKTLPSSTPVTELYASKEENGEERVFAAPGWWEAPAMSAAGFLRSTVDDMLLYLDLYRTGGLARSGERVLSSEGIARMMTPYIDVMEGYVYGYGLGITPNYHGVSIIGHSGGIKGVSANMAVIPERGITAALHCNLGGLPSGLMLNGALNLLLGLPLETRRLAPADYDCPHERLPRYVGVFSSGDGTVKIFLADGRLQAEMEGKVFPLRPVAVNVFAYKLKEDEGVIRFLFNSRGQVYAFESGGRFVRRVKDL